MTRVEFLTNEEMVELVIQAQAGSEDAENAIIKNCERLIAQHIRGWAGGGHDLEDLQQVAYIGLLHAIREFDTNKDNKFLSYALPCAKGAVKRFMRDNGPVKVPRTIKELAAKIKKEKLEQHSVKDIMEQLSVPKEKHVVDAIYFIQLKSGKPMSLDTTIVANDYNGDQEISLGDMLAGDINGGLYGEDWVDVFISNEVLSLSLRALSDQERQVITYRYFDLLNQTETGKLLGVSQMHISRLEKRALDKLAEYMGYSDRRKARTKIKEEVHDKTGARLGVKGNPKGDRERAIKLLQETDMFCSEISRETGVPAGTMFGLSKQYRSKEKNAAVKYRALEKGRQVRQANRELVAVQ
ncbi:RNA polymerase sigma factor [Bacillus phage Moonbeam]|uniref:RNA polymerase sigma factor n=1 Tax=Bacillus phage Moonbeam TaxID=1540091 RepID=A0A0A0RNH9_9CAUD|nr:RNA polymerase sigma factor [Bacillus phage Moonbeam]AIW03562.1 RNA polymerase sigma factor [Bacillus phage Moonbeam]